MTKPIKTVHDARNERAAYDAICQLREAKAALKAARASQARAKENLGNYGGAIWQRVVDKRTALVAKLEKEIG